MFRSKCRVEDASFNICDSRRSIQYASLEMFGVGLVGVVDPLTKKAGSLAMFGSLHSHRWFRMYACGMCV